MAKNVDDALFASGKKFNYEGDTPANQAEYEARTIVWGDGETPMTWSDIQTKIAELEALEYKEDRAAAYPAIGDQLDMLYHSIDADADLKTKFADFHTAVKAVKDANPKS